MNSTSIPPISGVPPDAARLTKVAYCVAALAFALPTVATFVGVGSAFSVGESLVQHLFVLGFLMLVAWLFTRSRSEVAKARGRMVVATLLFLTVFAGLADKERQEKDAKQFARDALRIVNDSDVVMREFSARFERFDISAVLTARSLTSPQGIALAHTQLSQFRALLAERRSLLNRFATEMNAAVSAVRIGPMRDAAEKAGATQRRSMDEVFSAVEAAQEKQVRAMEAILDWAQGESGRLRISGEQIVFSSEAQRSNMLRLTRALEAVDAEVMSAAKEATSRQQKLLADREESKRRLEQLLRP